MSAAQSNAAARPAVVVPGNHDGVHRGHRKLVARAREQAGPGGAVRVLTFDPHPAAVLAPEPPACG
ncbi:MAG: riboflavin biosynthesis protein RibF, partial [Myxococcales bacterium]|nr:riboflavin biosynthesis protein RibF [Myxococcales bacterium]